VTLGKSRPKFDRDDFLRKKRALESLDQKNRNACEASCVQFLLTRLGLAKRKWELLRQAEQRTGRRFLTLDLFNELVTNFPLWLSYSWDAGQGLHKNDKATMPALFNCFANAPFLPFYEEWYERAQPGAGGRAIGLVFPRVGIRHGFVLHSGEGLEGVWVPGSVWVYHGGTRDAPTRLYLRPFASLVEALYNRGHGWKPELAF